MEAFKKILRTPSAFVLFLVAVVSLIGIIITSETNKTIARIPIDATSTAEAKLTEVVLSATPPTLTPTAFPSTAQTSILYQYDFSTLPKQWVNNGWVIKNGTFSAYTDTNNSQVSTYLEAIDNEWGNYTINLDFLCESGSFLSIYFGHSNIGDYFLNLGWEMANPAYSVGIFKSNVSERKSYLLGDRPNINVVYNQWYHAKIEVTSFQIEAVISEKTHSIISLNAKNDGSPIFGKIGFTIATKDNHPSQCEIDNLSITSIP